MKYKVLSKGKKLLMIETLKKRFGFVGGACRELGISKQTHYKWLKSDSVYKEEFENLLEEFLDLAEAKLLELIEEGNFQATKFFLSKKGRKRGYGKEQEEEDSNKEGIRLIIEGVD